MQLLPPDWKIMSSKKQVGLGYFGNFTIQHLECIYMLKSKNAETGNNLKDVLNDNGFSAFLVLNE